MLPRLEVAAGQELGHKGGARSSVGLPEDDRLLVQASQACTHTGILKRDCGYCESHNTLPPATGV